MNNPRSVRSKSDADIVREILDGRYTSVVENSGDRPLRQALFQQMTNGLHQSGRFAGIISPGAKIQRGQALSSRHFSQDSIAALSGVSHLLEKLINREAAPLCPDCGQRGVKRDISELSLLWSGHDSGILLVGIQLDQNSGGEGTTPAEMVDYWGAQRIFDGEKLWSRDQLDDQWQAGTTSLYAILDSATLPASPGFDLQLQGLIERVQTVSSSPLSLFVRRGAGELIVPLGDVAPGWFCPDCLKKFAVTSETPQSIGLVDVATLPSLSITDLIRECSLAGIIDAELSEAGEVLAQAGLASLPLNYAAARLSITDLFLIRMVSAVMAGISDTLFILDDAPELFPSDRLVHFEQVSSRLRARHNRCVTLGIAPAAESLTGVFASGLECRQEISSPEVAITLPVGGMVRVVAPGAQNHREEYLFFQAGRSAQEGGLSGGLPWQRVFIASLAELRKASEVALVTALDLLEPLQDLVERSLQSDNSILSAAVIKKTICRTCLGLGSLVAFDSEVRACQCTSSRSDRDALMKLIIKGRSYRAWITAPMTELSDLFLGYAQSSALIGSLCALGAGRFSASTLFSTVPDGERQLFRIAALPARTERDLYKRTRTRRETKPALFLLAHPFLGLQAEQAIGLEAALSSLVLPDDTIGYLDSRVRFKNHDQCDMVPA